MRYTSLTGISRTGAVWSPGPLANSLWVLDDETGEPVVVKVPKGDVSAAHQLDYGIPLLEQDRWGALVWVHHYYDYHGRWNAESTTHAAEHCGSGRKLSEKVWRAAVGDQCAQLELTAA